MKMKECEGDVLVCCVHLPNRRAKPTVLMRYTRLLLTLALLLGFGSSALAQRFEIGARGSGPAAMGSLIASGDDFIPGLNPDTSYTFEPRNWWPLEVGSKWHYVEGSCTQLGIIDYVNEVTEQRLYEGDAWYRIQTVYNSADNPCSRQDDSWYRFSDDHYMLRKFYGLPGQTDTLWTTRERSIFESDSSLQRFRPTPPTPCAPDSLYFTIVYPEHPSYITTFGYDGGSESDSTNFVVAVNQTDTVGYCFNNAYFIYNIGYATDLLGFSGGGITWGDQSVVGRTVSNASVSRPSEPRLCLRKRPEKGGECRPA